MGEFQASHLISIIKSWTIRTSDELTLQNDLAVVLENEGVEFLREHSFSAKERVDFFCGGGVALECKIKGSGPAVLEQLSRYSQFEQVKEILLVTTKSVHRRLSGTQLQGKPVLVCWINNL